MIVCPLLSNPDVAREFNEIKDATTEKTAYNVWSKNNGNGIDKAPNGEPSILFNKLLLILNSRIKAIRKKAEYYGNKFLETFGNWIDDPGSVIGALDKNGEPIVTDYDKDKIERFIDSLIPKHRPYRTRSKHGKIVGINPEEELKSFFYSLLGVSLRDDDITDFENIDALKEQVAFFIRNNYKNRVEETLQYLLDKLNSIEDRATEQYLQNLLLFLERNDLSVLEEYDEKTQNDIKEFFPKLFRHKPGVSINSIFGYYKHALMQKSGPVYESIYKMANWPNIRRIVLQNKINKLTTIKHTLDLYPNITRRIINKVLNQIDRIHEYDEYLKGNRPTTVSVDSVENATINHNAGVYDYRSTIIEKGKIYSAKDVLEYISKDSRYKELVHVLQKTISTQGDIKIVGVEDPNKSYGGVYTYNTDTGEGNSIYINVSSDLYKTDPVHTLLHEMVHGITSIYLSSNPELEKSIEKYIDYIKSNIYNDGGFGFNIKSMFVPYGFKDSHEFIAEFMTNQEFRNLLKEIPAMEHDKFKSIFDAIINWILNLFGVEQTAYDQIKPILEFVIDAQKASFKNVQSTINLQKWGFDENGELATEESGFLPTSDVRSITEINHAYEDMDNYAVKQTIEALKKDKNTDILESVNNAKKEWIEQRQQEILGDTQMKLAEAYGLKVEVGEDGRKRFISEEGSEKANLIIDFLDYIEDEKQGYYDHNSKSSAAHHVIGISLTNGDPSTFSHELAHHYVRMFWNSKLIQTSLQAVYKDGMTDEEVEEALVDIITAKTDDAKFMSCVESQSFFLKFWGLLANMLYSTFGIENNAIRNQLYANITKAFVLNQQQKELDASKVMYLMYKGRVYKSKFKKMTEYLARKSRGTSKYKEAVNKVRDENRQRDSIIEYEQVNANKLHTAIHTIVQGTVSRNKEFRRSLVTNPEVQVQMLIQENTVRQFLEDINTYRKDFLEAHGLTNKKRKTIDERIQMASTPEETDANLKLIESFIDAARDELTDLVYKIISSEAATYTHYVQKEIVDPNTGDAKVEYLPATIANMQDPNLVTKELTFDEISSINQNVLGFYRKAIQELIIAVNEPEFRTTYGDAVTDYIKSELTAGSASLNSLLEDIELKYNLAVRNRIEQFCIKYVQSAMEGQPDDKIQRATYSIRQWLLNLSTWGDVSMMDHILRLPSHSLSVLVRLCQDVVDECNTETHREADKKAETLKHLRDKAIKSTGLKQWLYRGISPFNFDKLLIEKDRNGKPTGNFLDKVNRGQYYQDREKFIDSLLYGKGGVELKIRENLGDKDYEIEFDTDGEPVFPEGCESIENDFLHKLNDWTSHHAVRPFTKEYYDIKIDMLSRITREAQKSIQKDINDIVGACTIDGKVHTELLTNSKMQRLKQLYNQKSLLASIYDEYGNEKPVGSEARLIADELNAWHDVINGLIGYKKDTEAYEAAKAAAKDPDIFERLNTYPVINPDIWEEVEKISTRITDPRIDELRRRRNALKRIVVNKGILNPKLDVVWDSDTKNMRAGYEAFWENYKKIDEALYGLMHDLSKSTNPNVKAAVERLITKAPAKKTGSGVWYQLIDQQVRDRIKAENPGDPLWKEKYKKEMLKYQAEVRDEKGNLVETRILSIFNITVPAAAKIKINGSFIQSRLREPILAYSVIDPETSSDRFVDKRFDFNSNEIVQPITDDTKLDDLDVSYTNLTYINHIEKGTKETLRYFRALQNAMKEAYKNIPFAGRYDGRLVLKSGTTRQVYLSNPWNPFKPLIYWAKRLFFINETDIEINIDFLLRPDGSRSMNIPVRYIRRLNNPADINTDILGSVIDFYTMSVNFKNKSKNLSTLQNILYRVQLGTGKTINESNTNRKNQIDAIKGILNRQFYERLRVMELSEDNGVSYKETVRKMMLKLMPLIKSITTVGLLALNWIAAAVAWVDPELQVLTEAIVGKNYNMGTYSAAIFHVLKGLPSAIASLGSTRSSGIFGSHTVGGMAYFGLGSTVNSRYSRMDRSKFMRAVGGISDLVMKPFSLGEYTVNAHIYEIVMGSYKAVTNLDTGKLQFMTKREYYQHAYDHGISIWLARKNWYTNMKTLRSAYHIKNGRFRRKHNEQAAIITPEFERQISKEMRSKSTIANLIVPHTEKTGIQTNIILTFITVMRTFMLVAISERAKSLHDFQIDDPSIADEMLTLSKRKKLNEEYWTDKGGFNFQTKTVEDGMWSGFWRFLWHSRYYKYAAWKMAHPHMSTVQNEVKHKKEDWQIADTDLYGMNRMLAEIGIFLFFMCAQVLFHNKMVDGGDDDKYEYQLVDHLLLRVALVRTTFLTPSTIFEIITSVTASLSDIENKITIIELMKEIYAGTTEHGLNFDEWEKVKGLSAYKNKPKAFRSLLKVLSGLGLHAMYSSSNAEGIKAKTKWYLGLALWSFLFHKKELKTSTKSNGSNFRPSRRGRSRSRRGGRRRF